MKELNVYSTKGQKVDSVKLNTKIFDGKVNKAKLLAQAKEYYKKIKTKSTNTDYKIEINY